jgi:hypothetical protein
MVPRLALVVLGLLVVRPCAAQQPPLPPVDSAVVELRLADGSTVRGRIVAASDTSCTLRTVAGVEVTVPRRALVRWRSMARAGGGSAFAFNDPNRTRLFLAPTARTLPQGDGYVGDYFVFFPVVAYGATDWLTLSGGMSVFPGLRVQDQLLYLAPKIRVVQRRSLSVAVGATYMRLGWSDFVDAWGGVAYGVTTLGSEDAAITVGLGWPFASGGTTREPWVMAGGELRVARDIKLLAEGWKFPGATDVPVIAGIRFLGERLAVDCGVLRVLGADMTGVVPWVDFVANW